MSSMITSDYRYAISHSLFFNTTLPSNRNNLKTPRTNNSCDTQHVNIVNRVHGSYYTHNTSVQQVNTNTNTSRVYNSYRNKNIHSTRKIHGNRNVNANKIFYCSDSTHKIAATQQNTRNYANSIYNNSSAYFNLVSNNISVNVNPIFNNNFNINVNRTCNNNLYVNVNPICSIFNANANNNINSNSNRAFNRIKTHMNAHKIYNSYDATNNPTSAGQVNRLVLGNDSRLKLDRSSDRDFYSFPRFVTHVDDAFISTLTELYRERIPPGAEVLDLMSSWVSHLPPEVQYKRVVGHGLNSQELARNPRLDYFFVKDLNEDQTLEAKDCSFDAVLCTVSVQYLQQPEKVFAEIYRILKPGGLCIVSFSNRMFYEKAIRAWREGTDYSRIQLVVQYFQCVTGFTQPEVVKKLPRSEGTSPFGWLWGFLGGMARDPFHAVIAYRNFKPV